MAKEDVLRLFWIYAKIASRTEESVPESQALKKEVAALLGPPSLKLKLVGRELIHDALTAVFQRMRALTNGKRDLVVYARALLSAYKDYLIAGDSSTGDGI